jgi:hypothetical protein
MNILFLTAVAWLGSQLIQAPLSPIATWLIEGGLP